ncbi:MAG: amidohydrolase family protein [Candidatus Hodarchaeota archaeon]
MVKHLSENGFSNIPYFDVHTHFFPPKLITTIWSYFEENYWPIYRKNTPENLAKILISEYNVEHFVVLNYAHKKGIARQLNDWTNEFCKNTKKRAIPFGTIHPEDENKANEMDRIFDSFGFAGIKLQLMVTNFHIWDKHMDPVYQKITQYDRILLVHIGTGPSYSNFNPGMTTQCPYVGINDFNRFLQKYPEMKVVIPHLGADEYEEMWALVKKFPNLYFDTAMIGVKNNPAFDDKLTLIDDEKLYEISDRIMFGSDFPNIPYDYRNSILGWIERDMNYTFYEKLFFRNAESLFKEFI